MRVIFHTNKSDRLRTQDQDSRASLFPLIHVLNFWVPERARLILHDKLLLYVLNFEYAKLRGLRDTGIIHMRLKPSTQYPFFWLDVFVAHLLPYSS